MTKLALLTFLVLTIFLLRKGQPSHFKPSLALWIPTVWFLLILSKPVAIWFSFGNLTNEEGSPYDRLILTVLLILGVIVLIRRRFQWGQAIQDQRWFVILVLYMLVSCLWSDLPFLSFRRWTRELIALVMIAVAITEVRPRLAFEILIRRVIYVLLPLSWVLINYFGELGRTYVHHQGLLMWIGVTGHKNQLGQLCLIAAFFLTWSLLNRRSITPRPRIKKQDMIDIFLIMLSIRIMCGPELKLTYSATSFGTLVLGLVSLAIIWVNRGFNGLARPVIIRTIMILLIIYGTLTPFLGSLDIFDISGILNRDKTLTGRTEVWKELAPVVLRRPVFGDGFEAFWTTSARIRYDISGAHNGYLEMMLGLGLFGILLFTIFILHSAGQAMRESNEDWQWASLQVCFVLMLLIHNITESSLNCFTYRLTAVVLFLIVAPPVSYSGIDIPTEGLSKEQ